MEEQMAPAIDAPKMRRRKGASGGICACAAVVVALGAGTEILRWALKRQELRKFKNSDLHVENSPEFLREEKEKKKHVEEEKKALEEDEDNPEEDGNLREEIDSAVIHQPENKIESSDSPERFSDEEDQTPANEIIESLAPDNSSMHNVSKNFDSCSAEEEASEARDEDGNDDASLKDEKTEMISSSSNESDLVKSSSEITEILLPTASCSKEESENQEKQQQLPLKNSVFLKESRVISPWAEDLWQLVPVAMEIGFLFLFLSFMFMLLKPFTNSEIQ